MLVILKPRLYKIYTAQMLHSVERKQILGNNICLQMIMNKKESLFVCVKTKRGELVNLAARNAVKNAKHANLITSWRKKTELNMPGI